MNHNFTQKTIIHKSKESWRNTSSLYWLLEPWNTENRNIKCDFISHSNWWRFAWRH